MEAESLAGAGPCFRFTIMKEQERRVWIFRSFLGVVIVFFAMGASFQSPVQQEIEDRLYASQTHSLTARLMHLTEPFLGAPYVISPLGEGPAHDIDPDPRIRFDAFDCTTFVETGIALSMADSYQEAQTLLDVIRYRNGDAHFIHRRHFPESEWIPELIEMGFLQDITAMVAGKDVSFEKKRLDLKRWKKRKKKILDELPTSRIPIGTFTLPVWPLKKAYRSYKKIPEGTVLNLVRINRESVPVRVSHQGLVINKNGKLYLRHAADRMYHSVVDEPLKKFFKRMMAYKKWPVEGINLLQITEPKDWRTRLLRHPTHASWPHRPHPLP